MIDIGVGHYRIKSENEIDAIWYSSRLDKKKIGKGIAIGDTSNGFPGEYKITYFDPDGNNTGTNYAIYADADSANTNYAGYFKGRVHILNI